MQGGRREQGVTSRLRGGLEPQMGWEEFEKLNAAICLLTPMAAKTMAKLSAL